jgi:radical SAM superfamily enzyme YgiQ (UPF0313 family)
VKIALVAMSGVRVQDPELLALGLTLPGFVERSKVIASLPSLSLLTLAALTPADVELSYHEVADLEADALPAWRGPDRPDLVAISTMTAQAFDAYALADRLRAAGIPVVLGGLHATCVPDECAEHADAVVVGEGEPVWVDVVEDARRGRLQPRYRADAPFDLRHAPVPRYDLLDPSRYNRLTLQTARGCPHKCSFCASSILLTPGYSCKPAERVDAELAAMKRVWPRPFVELADDNSFASRRHAGAVLDVLGRHSVRWFTETDVSIADDPSLLAEMKAAGCRQVLMGLESPTDAGLPGIDTRDWKLRQFPRYEQAVRTVQASGITAIGCFVLGLDGHTPAVFDAVFDFARRTSLYDVQITVQTPFPGTPLYTRLEREGRLTHPGRWDRCTLFDINYEPLGMSAAELRAGLLDLTRRLYDPAFVRERREGFFRQLRSA